MPELSFCVESWAAWAPGRERREDWLHWAGTREAPVEHGPVVGDVPPLLRRRVGPMGQHALRLAWAAAGVRHSRLVFASRHGELDRTLSILGALAREEAVSPADFSLSVHHALAGLLSVAAGNRKGHTTVAAGADSFLAAMLEAAACLGENPDESVILVYHDAPLPDPFSDFHEVEEECLAMTLSLTARTGSALRLTLEPRKTVPAVESRPALAFLEFLLGGRPSVRIEAERLSWRCERADVIA